MPEDVFPEGHTLRESYLASNLEVFSLNSGEREAQMHEDTVQELMMQYINQMVPALSVGAPHQETP